MTSDGDLLPAPLTETLYRQLRQLAARRLRAERPGQTLQATELVHEAILRMDLFNQSGDNLPDAVVFGAAAEAMRRILIDQARRKQRQKHGGHLRRISLSIAEPAALPEDSAELIDINAAITKLEVDSPERAEVVKLRFFAGLSMPDVARILNISLATAERRWAMARAWLHREISQEDGSSEKSQKA